MITGELKHQVLRHFNFTPTPEQDQALTTLSQFLTDRDSRSVMIFRGSAGTGKTTIAGAVVRTLLDLKMKVVLLAPTGRAAKVFSVNSGHVAYTIHRCIYREQAYKGVLGTFNLGNNLYQHTLFMVDEASMVYRASDRTGNKSFEDGFGSGSLLDDLIHYIYSGQHDRLILIGDQAQLPPIGDEEAPALCTSIIQSYGLKVFQCDLNEVLRQKRGSGILYNASNIRNEILSFKEASVYGALTVPKIHFDGFADVVRLSGEDLIEQLSDSYSEVGMDETIVITRSNKRANIYNQGIRSQVLGIEDELCGGDQIMIVRNNYYWMAQNKKENSQQPDPSGHQEQNNRLNFIANGDRAEVERAYRSRELYGFHFIDVDLRFPDYDDQELSATVIMDSLQTDSPALSREQVGQLYDRIMEDYADIPRKTDRINRLRGDIYFNALQIKFAYAVTCHKAQGGQWNHVYLDQGYITEEMLSPSYFHWLYTAITRATGKLYLINWPKTQIGGETEKE